MDVWIYEYMDGYWGHNNIRHFNFYSFYKTLLLQICRIFYYKHYVLDIRLTYLTRTRVKTRTCLDYKGDNIWVLLTNILENKKREVTVGERRCIRCTEEMIIVAKSTKAHQIIMENINRNLENRNKCTCTDNKNIICVGHFKMLRINTPMMPNDSNVRS